MNQTFRAPLLRVSVLLDALVEGTFARTQLPLALQPSPSLEALVDRAAEETLTRFSARKVERDQLAITLVDLSDSGKPTWASFRGDVQIYPASAIKMFYLAAVHRWIEDGKLKDTEELRRAMRDMIVNSLNEATGLIVDSPTDTTSGPELPADELE